MLSIESQLHRAAHRMATDGRKHSDQAIAWARKILAQRRFTARELSLGAMEVFSS